MGVEKLKSVSKLKKYDSEKNKSYKKKQIVKSNAKEKRKRNYMKRQGNERWQE